MNKQQVKQLHEMSNEELWLLFPIILSEYKGYWPERYLSEKVLLTQIILSENIYRINHMGSTSVPGLLAKPTIDILLEINPDTDVENLIGNMENAGYIYSPQPNNPVPHILFMKGYTNEGFKGQVFHIHVRYPGDWNELYFRDYLRDNSDIADKYAMLKRELKDKYEHDRDTYTLAKTEFITCYTNLARKKYKGRYVVNNPEAG